MAPTDSPNLSSDASEIDQTLEAKKCKRFIPKYGTMVLGNAAADKSTFVQWLDGFNTKLISELVPGSASEFVIRNETNSTTKSMLPLFVLDKTGNYYYDWPVFSDNLRNSEYISSPYSLKSVSWKYVQNVRLLFVIDYPAVKDGSDQRKFVEFLKHSIYFLKNVDKYCSSIALVVTKVDNTPVKANEDVNGKIGYETDEKVIDSIAHFMKIVRKDLKRDTKTNENYVKLIDAFLQRDDQAYSKIALFRRPDMAGPLSEIPLLVKGKAKLGKIIKLLKFAPIEKNDFGYSISDNSKTTDVEDLENLSQASDNSKTTDVEDIENVSQASNTFTIEATKLYTQFGNGQQTVNMLSSQLTASLFSKSDCLVIDEPSLDSHDWYQFLKGLTSKLGEYQFQQNTSRYNVANVEDWGKGQTKPQNIQINEQNFNQFLNNLSQYNISGIEQDTQVAQWQLDELNQVLSSTLKHAKANFDCTGDGKLVVTGDYVKLSELKPRLVEMCLNIINSVNIFASHTLFIDSDLDGLGSELKLSLLAPKSEVVGLRRINLDGSAGAPPNPLKARNSNHTGVNPETGRPGLNGGAAGSFLGLAQQFVIREGLTVTANGGAGGDGQEGGDGHDGERGTDAPVPDQWCHFDAPYEVTWTKSEMHGFTQYNYTDYRIYGSSGTAGGVGGDGGAGGIGGQQGVIELYNLDGSNKQKMDTKPGRDGNGGRGGIGGFDGLHGNDLKAHCEFYFTWGFWTRKCMSSEPITYDHRNRAQNGRDGANHDPDPVRVPKVVSLNLHSANTINEYKNYLRSRLNDVNDRFSGLSAIVDQLEKNNFVKGKFVSLKNGDLNHSTELLLNQIAKYAEALQPTENIDQFRKMLSNLSTVDKLYNLNSSPGPNLVYDVDGFLYYVQDIINILNKLRNQQRPEHEAVQLANLIVNINSDQFTGSTDPQILVVAKELETLIRSNFVLQQYDSVVVALKQLIFPYAQFYVDETDFNRNSTDIEYLINSAVVSLSKMRSRVLENRSSIWKVDQYAHEAIFDSAHLMTSPFHVWLNGENRNAIHKLLSGESIVLNADIRLSDSDKDAIKFSLLEINLKAKNSTAQAEINTELNNFLVSATQLGNFNYRYDDKYYLINNFPLNIEYSFAKDSNGQPIAHNEVYRKIRAGDLMASPYAMWQIQLSKMNEMVSFDRLAAYRDAVDLELVGQGIYSESERARSDYLQVERYYSEYIDDTRAQSNVVERQQLRKAKVMKVNSLHRSEVRVPEQVSNSTGPLSYISRLGETVSNLFGSNSTVNTHQISHPRIDYTRQHSDNTNNATNLTQSPNSVDVQGNLLLGQLLVGLIAGKNGTLSSESYMSPEKARAVQVESLAQRIVPVLSQSSATRSSQLYNSNNQWHRDWNATSREQLETQTRRQYT